jgi:GDPmannose 4,6-dehydratase
VAQAVAAIKQGRALELELSDLSAERDWSDARDIVRGFWLSLQAKAPGDFVFASGARRRVEELVECAFRAAGLDFREFVKLTKRNADAQQVATGLCGNPHKAESELSWKRQWSFAQTVEDMVRAELESRPEIARADPQPERRTAQMT